MLQESGGEKERISHWDSFCDDLLEGTMGKKKDKEEKR